MIVHVATKGATASLTIGLSNLLASKGMRRRNGVIEASSQDAGPQDDPRAIPNRNFNQPVPR